MRKPVTVALAVFAALTGLALPARADVVYSTLPTSAGNWDDNGQISAAPAVEFNSGGYTSIDSITFNLRGSGAADVKLYTAGAGNLPDYAGGLIADLGTIPNTSWGENAFYTLGFAAQTLVADTEYWIAVSTVSGGGDPWWVATFQGDTSVTKIGTIGQYTAANGSSALTTSTDEFEMQINGTAGAAAVSEPASMALLGFGLLGVVVRRRRAG